MPEQLGTTQEIESEFSRIVKFNFGETATTLETLFLMNWLNNA